MKKYKLSGAGNIEAPAYHLIKEKGYTISCENELWKIEGEDVEFMSHSLLEVLGLILLYESKGQDWLVSDEKIEEFIHVANNS